jgi:hypothetical protein
MNVQIACPNCRSSISLPVNGNAVGAPLVCRVCGQAFSPHFYCPDARSPSRHIFVATALLVDNAGAVYTFCPEHTFTTYTLAADSRPRPKRTPLRSLARFFDSLAFRIALAVEGLRWLTFSRR